MTDRVAFAFKIVYMYMDDGIYFSIEAALAIGTNK